MIIRKVLVISVMLTLFIAFTVKAAPFSEYWIQDDGGSWLVRTPDGQIVRNAWLCDDAVPENGKDVWYLLGDDGKMVTSPLVKDGTGNFYSIETEHNGYYGMLRNKSGTYGGISLKLQESHEGGFASILNEDGRNELEAAFGVLDVSYIDNADCVYTGEFYKEKADTVKETDVHSEKIINASSNPEKVMADFVDEDLCAQYFIEYLNEYRESLGLSRLSSDEGQMEYAKERAYRESVSHKENTAAYEICSTHGVLPSEYESVSVEEAVARSALKYFKASSSHNSIMKLKGIKSAGAGFHIVADKSDGTFNFYYCEANFEK